MEKQVQNPAVYIVTVILWLIIIFSSVAFVHNIFQRFGVSVPASDRDLPIVSTTVEKALSRTQTRDTIRYNGTYKSPFKSSYQPVPKTPRRFGNYTRVAFRLKAVLIKKNPLAILEDMQGETYICKVGEIVHGQEILKITGDKVVLRDPKGTYDLAVQED